MLEMHICEKLKMKVMTHEENVEFVDLVKSFPTRIWSQIPASVQPRTSCVVLAKNAF